MGNTHLYWDQKNEMEPNVQGVGEGLSRQNSTDKGPGVKVVSKDPGLSKKLRSFGSSSKSKGTAAGKGSESVKGQTTSSSGSQDGFWSEQRKHEAVAGDPANTMILDCLERREPFRL